MNESKILQHDNLSSTKILIFFIHIRIKNMYLEFVGRRESPRSLSIPQSL